MVVEIKEWVEHHSCVQTLQFRKNKTHHFLLRACIHWVQSLLNLEYNILKASDGHVAVNVELVSVHKALCQQAKISWLLFLRWHCVFFLLHGDFFIFLRLDTVWNDLGFFCKDI